MLIDFWLKMEAVEHELRAEVADLERAVSAKEGEILEERLLTTPNDLQYSERTQNNCQMAGVVAFLKQKLEQVDRSKTDLEERLREKVACEERLRESLQEYEQSDIIWQEKVLSLQGQKKTLMQNIDDLQARLTDVKVCYIQRSSPTISASRNQPDIYPFARLLTLTLDNGSGMSEVKLSAGDAQESYFLYLLGPLAV